LPLVFRYLIFEMQIAKGKQRCKIRENIRIFKH